MLCAVLYVAWWFMLPLRSGVVYTNLYMESFKKPLSEMQRNKRVGWVDTGKLTNRLQVGGETVMTRIIVSSIY